MSEPITLDRIKIQEKIKKAFLEFGETSLVADEIAFHLTDWTKDLTEIVKVYSEIDRISNDDLTVFLFSFMAHVPNHLNAAKKLSGMGKVTDVFEVGIFEDE